MKQDRGLDSIRQATRLSKEDKAAILNRRPRPTTYTDLAFFLFGGLSCFVVTYCMMSQVHFWHETYGGKGYLIMIFAANLGGFSAFLFYKPLFANMKKKSVLLALPVVNWVIILILVLTGEHIAIDSPLKLVINVVGNYIFCFFLFLFMY